MYLFLVTFEYIASISYACSIGQPGIITKVFLGVHVPESIPCSLNECLSSLLATTALSNHSHR